MNFEYFFSRFKNHIDKQIDISCCLKPVELIFRPNEQPNPSVLLRCDKCRKEMKMILSKFMGFSCDDLVLNESIKILSNQWKKKELERLEHEEKGGNWIE